MENVIYASYSWDFLVSTLYLPNSKQL